MGLAAPYFQKTFIDGLIEYSRSIAHSMDTDSTHRALWALILTLIAGFTTSFGAVLTGQLTAWYATRESVITQKSLADSMYRRLLGVRGGLVGNAPSGEAVSLFAVDVSGSVQVLEQCIPFSASLFFPILFAPWVLNRNYDIPWTHSIGALLALLVINGLLALRQSRFFYLFKQLAQERTGKVNEWIQNIRTLRILGWVGSAEEKIFEVRRRETSNRLAMVTNGQLMNAVAGSSSTLLNILAIGFWIQTHEATATPGQILSLVWLVNVFLARPLRQFPWIFVMAMDALSSMRRLEKAFQKEFPAPRVLQGTQTLSSETTSGSLTPALDVRGLELVLNNQPKLKGLHFHIGPEELVAIVGEVGSGKTLLLQSLLGETGATFLSFKLDGQDTRGPIDPSVKSHFAYVPQEGFTMSATLRENVVFQYGAPASQDSNVLNSLALAQFVPDQEGLTSGAESEIGERGVNLSGGQRQRIGLARAHYAHRKILLLDDPLSAVDVETERALLRTLLEGEWKRLPRLLVTHRMSILPHCDRILFMDEGRILLEGKYADLLKTPSFRNFVLTTAQQQRAEDASILNEPAALSSSEKGIP